MGCWSVDGVRRFAPGQDGAKYDDLLIEFDSETGKQNTAGDTPHCQSKRRHATA
jgi:hypothetical protein